MADRKCTLKDGRKVVFRRMTEPLLRDLLALPRPRDPQAWTAGVHAAQLAVLVEKIDRAGDPHVDGTYLHSLPLGLFVELAAAAGGYIVASVKQPLGCG